MAEAPEINHPDCRRAKRPSTFLLTIDCASTLGDKADELSGRAFVPADIRVPPLRAAFYVSHYSRTFGPIVSSPNTSDRLTSAGRTRVRLHTHTRTQLET